MPVVRRGRSTVSGSLVAKISPHRIRQHQDGRRAIGSHSRGRSADSPFCSVTVPGRRGESSFPSVFSLNTAERPLTDNEELQDVPGNSVYRPQFSERATVIPLEEEEGGRRTQDQS